MDDMILLGLDPFYESLQIAFTGENDNNMSDKIENFLNMHQEDQDSYLDILKASGVSRGVIKNFERQIGMDGFTQIEINDNENRKESEQLNVMHQLAKVKDSPIKDFNPFLFGIDIEIGKKIFGEKRFHQIYNEQFFSVVEKLLQKSSGLLPDYKNFVTLPVKKIRKQSSEKEDNKFIDQYIIEWMLPESFKEEQLSEIACIMKEEFGDINTQKPTNYESLFHPILTISKKAEYIGYFGQSGNLFEENHILIQRSKDDKKKRKLRLVLENFEQSSYIYLLTQISYFLENNKFIVREQLYFNIYHELACEFYGTSDIFSMDTFPEQYKQIVETMIIPLSQEAAKLELKASNILLAGLYGTGKSQFLLNLLLNKNFHTEGKDFHLNANVISVDITTFKGALIQTFGGFRTQIQEIYDRTGVPIILLIEDIDTLVNEQLHQVNDEVAQAMTVFFEGIGSLPVTIVATANDPYKLSQRLIRPGRISQIVFFGLPSETERKNILSEHLKRANIDVSQELQEKLIKTKFEVCTASHIGDFVKKLNNHNKTLELIGKKVSLSDETIIEIANKVNIPVDDLKKTEKSTEEWLKLVRGEDVGTKIGFMTDK